MAKEPTKATTFLTEHVSLLPTEDGSLTLYHHGCEASYRSTSGALTESRHVFLEGTELPQHRDEWRVLELGFGGAVNFLLTATTCLARQDVATLRYWAVEREPLPPSLLELEAYTSWIQDAALLAFVQQAMLRTQQQPHTWAESTFSLSGTTIHLSLFAGNWQEVAEIPSQVQAVYHDPFGPKVNADAWTTECFAWSQQWMETEARLATFSAAGAVRRAMAAAGLHWKKIPGPGRKREITIASPSPFGPQSP